MSIPRLRGVRARSRTVARLATVPALALIVFVGLASVPAATADGGSHRVLVGRLDGAVDPVTQGYVDSVLHRAVREGYDAVVIEMDTPGGLGSSMRKIVQTMLGLQIPVIVYVTPAGADAGSAGAVIGQAADVLALAPQTTIGAATPIQASGEDFPSDLRRKVVNDAAALVGELAREHGRNAAAATAMVRQARSYGAREAVALRVADVVAQDLPTLLQTIDGRIVQPKDLAVQTGGAAIDRQEMSWWKKALDALIDPNVIALLLSIGLVGIVVELWHPGLVLPGTVGAISLLLGLYGLSVLPVSLAGALLLLLAAALFVTDAFVPTHGALTLAGAVTFVVAALMLFDPAGAGFQVSPWTAVALAGLLVALLGLALRRVVAARRNPVEVGVSTLVGQDAVVRADGWVSVAGERWHARSADGRQLVPGAHVTVREVEDGLELVVGSDHPNERSAR